VGDGRGYVLDGGDECVDRRDRGKRRFDCLRTVLAGHSLDGEQLRQTGHDTVTRPLPVVVSKPKSGNGPKPDHGRRADSASMALGGGPLWNRKSSG
jgi:hypothetical protein